MTTSPNTGLIPELTLGWRLRMARETTGMGLREFAAHIGVTPDTLTSAEKDRRKVRPITINAYALATGVSREWLETGEPTTTPPPPGDEARDAALRKLTASKRARGTADTRRSSTQRYLTQAA